MYPTIDLGVLQLSSFSVMLVLAFLVAALIGVRQATLLKIDPQIVWSLLPWAAVAGLVGAQLYSVVLSLLQGGVSDPAAALSNRGQVFYGGLIAGVVVVAWRFRRTGHPLHILFDYGVPCVAIAHAIGRIGCFLVGDDYGYHTSLPWAVAFPNGAPPSTAGYLRSMGDHIGPDVPASVVMAVHPVQLYEALVLAILGAMCWSASRRPHRPFTVFAAYAIAYGLWRFGIEFLRPKNDHLIGSITSAQIISLGLLLLGIVLVVRARGATGSR
jgi:phosphatidylglycerol:prolipoprotein diacylglycerol transferase